MARARVHRPPLASVEAPVSLGCVVTEPELPAPVVHYPSHYGAFIAFATDPTAVPALCACTRPLFEGEGADAPSALVADPWRGSALPVAVVAAVKATGAFPFVQGACHRCTRTAPSVRWCHEMYGGKFKQTFGWYIQQAGWRLRRGAAEGHEGVVAEYAAACGERADAVRERAAFQQRLAGVPVGLCGPVPDPGALLGKALSPEDAATLRALAKREAAAERALGHLVENLVRDEFGYPRVGERWRSETELRALVARLLPGEVVVAHDRPTWLDGLELDVHVPGRHLAFEYQGQQHFHAIEAWGGEPALRALRERDARKVEACRRHGVRLVVLTYQDPIDLDGLRARLNPPIDEASDSAE